MRLIERVLFVANLLTICILTISQFYPLTWPGYLAFVAVLIAVVQLSLEGYRWQMIPAYLLTGLLLLGWFIQNSPVVGGDLKQLLNNPVAIGLYIGLGVLILLASLALPVVLPVFRFPKPGGPYQIGTVSYYFKDTSRQEIFSTDPTACRELMVQVWYPVTGNSSSQRASYLQDATKLAPVLARLVHLPHFTLNHFKYVTTNAIPSAPLSPNMPNYPVLIFLEGLGGFRQMNTFQIEELVSHGYIVTGIDQPYAAAAVVFPDGHQTTGLTKDQMEPFTQQSLSPVEPTPMLNGQALKNGNLPYFAQDVCFTLDQLTALNKNDPNGILTGRLDMQRVGTFGISLGAMVASEACYLEPRLRACLLMDAAMPADVVQAGLQQPAMWITRDADTMRLERQKAGGWSEADISQTLGTMRAVFEKHLSKEAYYVQVPGIFHLNFTDIPYFSPLAPRLGFAGPLNVRRTYDIINTYTLTFFDQYLGNGSGSLLEGPDKQYPEVLFEKRQP